MLTRKHVHSCAEIYQKVKLFGFTCSDSLKQLNFGDIKLSDTCCATCLKAKKTLSQPKEQSQPKETCWSAQYKGDGNCDDENNNKGCAYDGGDCCPKTVAGGEVSKKYCTKVGHAYN